MSEWAVALIAAGSALAGGAITGWFTRSAGHRQADAARHAGDRQADALLDTVRATLDEQRAVRVLDLRRQTYVRFLDAAEAGVLAFRTGAGHGFDRSLLQQALGGVLLEGPDAVADAARELSESLRGGRPLADIERARTDFLTAARAALVA